MKLWKYALLAVLLLSCALVQQSLPTRAKTPTWASGEHPRLLATAGERTGWQAKFSTNGTTSKALWDYFAGHNLATATSAGYINYADAGVLYWINGNATNGQQAHDAVMNYVNSSSNVITPTLANYDLAFWQYRDMLLNFDFAYDRFSPAERQTIYSRILLQGVKCHYAGAAWGVGNVHALWGLCEYASAVMLEGENISATITDEPVTRLASGTDKLKYPVNAYNITIRSAAGGSVTYTAGTDYNTCYSSYEGDRCIDWSPGGSEPTAGTVYYVSYTVEPQLEKWRIGARQFIENHLNYHWRDGTYTGGYHPYSGAALESIIDFLEIARRDMGVDYSQDVDLKHYIDMALYEWLPSAGNSWVGYRYDTFSDAGGWGEDPVNHPTSIGTDYRGWARRMVAYGMSRYGNDPVYGSKYLWFWGQFFRNANGTIKQYNTNGAGDWREAMYFNDGLTTGYPVTTLPTPNWPTYRFFRGRDLVIARTDEFRAPNPNAAYVSLLAQNHNHQSEHDQGDSGSFTFYSNDEDWAIDPGYQQSNGSGGNSYDHNTVGIDGAGYYANGVYGQAGTTPAYGGYSNVERVALTSGASAIKANLTSAWSLTETSFVDHQYRYLAMVNGGPSSYLIVGDDVQKDNSNHTYQWYFQAGLGNTVTRTGSVTTLVGARGHAELDIHTIAPNPTSAVIEDWSAGNYSYQPYKRLKISSGNTINPHFLNLLIPTPTGQPKPAVTQSTVTNGVRATVTWSNGLVDVIYWRTTNGSIDDGVVGTDAALTVLRTQSDALTGLMIMDGRTVSRNGSAVFQALDGVAPVTFSSFDSDAAVSGLDTSRVAVGLSGLASAHIAEGIATVDVAHQGSTTFLTAGLPFDMAAMPGGRYLDQSFSDPYVHNLVVTNFERFPITDQAVNNGVLDVRATNWDWVSLSRRDSTSWRRSNHTPSAIPADQFGDGDYQFRYRFTDTTSAGRKLRFYFRVYDREAADWLTNQNYLRLELNPVAGQATIGTRSNGAWADIDSDDNLTAATATVSGVANDANWHQVAMRLAGSNITLTIDGQVRYDGVLSGPIPTVGYLQWRVIGAAHVQLDDLTVTAIDAVPPVAPSAGTITPLGTTGQVGLAYDLGLSPDISRVVVYQSDQPIVSTDDPTALAVAGQTVGSGTVTIAALNRTAYYAAAAFDPTGNRSQLTSLTIDNTAPGTVGDLRAD